MRLREYMMSIMSSSIKTAVLSINSEAMVGGELENLHLCRGAAESSEPNREAYLLDLHFQTMLIGGHNLSL